MRTSALAHEKLSGEEALRAIGNMPKLDRLEKAYLKEVLVRAQGVQKDAAKIAGLTERVMSYKVRKYGLRDFVRIARLQAAGLLPKN